MRVPLTHLIVENLPGCNCIVYFWELMTQCCCVNYAPFAHRDAWCWRGEMEILIRKEEREQETYRRNTFVVWMGNGVGMRFCICQTRMHVGIRGVQVSHWQIRIHAEREEEGGKRETDSHLCQLQTSAGRTHMGCCCVPSRALTLSNRSTTMCFSSRHPIAPRLP